ncbi:diguanylate cyclase (GGDEF)-like protein [Anaerosolibacter carboniphilus]|uniref:Diguanylate cyclase (GGDEF)-like protein n=1 Tax=Anaerosolibacter carboniphilus TaxID=1417629 RepID=A0A841L325_9FIRM|nr:GGDEF domain-containing protein [Anaerosolibacter carboniphilus]MBB6216789.1 diguanylate cyclase (GGDEF)-like protein [Anaerosolibacter carboniphilus]
MHQINNFRDKMIYELYLGVQVLSIIAMLIFFKSFTTFSVNPSPYTNVFLWIYGLYVLGKFIHFIYKNYFLELPQILHPSLWIMFTDGIFLTFFLYITKDSYYVLSHLFYLYITIQTIIFHARHSMISSTSAAIFYIFLVVMENPKSLISAPVAIHIGLFYLLGYIISSVMNELHRLEAYSTHMYEELKRKNEQLSEIANKDYLTSMYNHKSFYCHFNEIIQHATISNVPFSLALFDIDDFKKINDTYGHLSGDMVLKEVSFLILETIRKTDIAARYGGEEFALIFPNTSPEEAEKICERIREAIESHPVITDEHTIHVTISGGMAGGILCNQHCKQHKLLEFVDQLLYEAKSHGKNQIRASYQTLIFINE